MQTTEKKAGTFEKVAECLYRYSSNGVYYARFESQGKEIRRSLRTTDRATAKRKLGDLQRDLARTDLSAGKCTLSDLCDRYLATIQHQKPKTVRRKQDIAAAIKRDFPGGTSIFIDKVVPSKVLMWLASYNFGAPSYNLYLEFTRAIFAMAVGDRLLAHSPIEHLKGKKLTDPQRDTPTNEEFHAIVDNIRRQPFNADAKDSADYVEFMGLIGLGQAEIATFTWGDFTTAEHAEKIRVKTGRGFPVPLFPGVRVLLERMRGELGYTPDPHEPIFKQKDARKALRGACERLGFRLYSHRSFRRMFITRRIEQGIDIQTIASWQGHTDGGKLLLSKYGKISREHSALMAKRVLD